MTFQSALFPSMFQQATEVLFLFIFFFHFQPFAEYLNTFPTKSWLQNNLFLLINLQLINRCFSITLDFFLWIIFTNLLLEFWSLIIFSTLTSFIKWSFTINHILSSIVKKEILPTILLLDYHISYSRHFYINLFQTGDSKLYITTVFQNGVP